MKPPGAKGEVGKGDIFCLFTDLFYFLFTDRRAISPQIYGGAAIDIES